MALINPFRRVDLNALLGGGSTYGDWGPSVNISAPLPNSRGKPLDWWVRGAAAGAITNGFRKGGSPNLFTVSVLNPTDGSTFDPGHVGSWPDGQVTWTDGPAGNVSGSTNAAHVLDGPTGVGSGFRIQIPNASQWPDWMLLKVWSFDTPNRRMKYTASLSNPDASSDAIIISLNEVNPGIAAVDDYSEWTKRKLITTEVKFAADGPGQTLTYDLSKFYAYNVSIYAVALYRAAPVPSRALGVAQALAATQRGRPAGA